MVTRLKRAVLRLRTIAAVLPITVLLLATTFQPAQLPYQPQTVDATHFSAGSAVRSSHGMVVSGTELSSKAGIEILKAGGNAVDAAIATGFALAVTHPVAGNIGGGGFMVIRFPDGRVTAFDFREKAPLKSNPRMFLDENGEYSSDRHHNSYLSVGVPGTVAGFAKAHATYGRLSWENLVGPAVQLAADGFAVMPGLARSLRLQLPRFRPYPASMRSFSNNGEPYAPGERLRQPDLARTLQRIQQDGRDGFYKGETAHMLVEEMRKGGGIITEEDLLRYEAKERTPITGTYRGYEIISMPPPSSGGVALVEMLNILEGYDLRAMGHNSPRYIHHLVESMRRAFQDRARLLGDVDFVEVPIDRLTSKQYADKLRESISESQATPSHPSDVVLPYESPQTAHYSVVDSGGMAVSVTYTLEQGYGSKITVAGAGFLLNNEMGDFNGRQGLTATSGLIGTAPNLARPEQRMLSSMTPSIVARDGKLVAVTGSPGGRTIINSVLQVILNIVDFKMDVQNAVDASRIHHQWLPDQVRIENHGITNHQLQLLERMGHSVRVGGRQGITHSIMIDPDTGERLGAADARDADGAAVGY